MTLLVTGVDVSVGDVVIGFRGEELGLLVVYGYGHGASSSKVNLITQGR